MLQIRQNSKSYPNSFNELAQPPTTIYIEGDLTNLLKSPMLAVVGSRKASVYGQSVTQQIVRGVAARGIVIVGGLALGIDSVAHKAAIEAGGKTIAILPSGLSNIYPSSHANLAKNIVGHGGVLISEYPPKTTVWKSNFIARNRLIAALSQAVLITEAAERSGSLHTANFALELGREVLAVPGPINSPTSIGCNNLIKSGAIPITSTEDVLAIFKVASPENKTLGLNTDNESEHILIKLISGDSLSTNELISLSKLSSQEVNLTLSMLEIRGRITAVAGKWMLK